MSGEDEHAKDEGVPPPPGATRWTDRMDVVLPLPPDPLVVPASAPSSSLEAAAVPAEDPRTTKAMTTVLPLPAAREGLAPTVAAPAVEPASRPLAAPRGVDSQAATQADARLGASSGSLLDGPSSADAPLPVAVSLRSSGDGGAVSLQMNGLRIGSELGRGAQGIVYRAAQAAGGPDVAVKLLRPEASDDEVARFEGAIDAMEALRDVPGIVQARARGRTLLGQPWFSMDLVQGPSLRTALEAGLLPPRALVALVADAARAVHDAHDRGIVHRDLKPENILVELLEDGACVGRVADFGLARDLHAAGSSSLDGAGTLAYMAPEQITGGEVTRRTDVHALGAVLFEVITGAPPFRRPTQAAVAQAIVNEPARAPATLWSGLPATLGPITVRALAKDPAARQQTAAQLATQLERALAGDTLDDVPASPRAAQGGPGLGRRVAAALRARSRFLRGVAMGVVLGVGLGWLAGTRGWGPERSRPEQDRKAPSTRRR